jgi:hypothetical protein
MAAPGRARRVGQRRLEGEPEPEDAEPTPEEDAGLPPTPAEPTEPAVPPEGSSAALRRRQLRWLEERSCYEDRRAASAGRSAASNGTGGSDRSAG